MTGRHPSRSRQGRLAVWVLIALVWVLVAVALSLARATLARAQGTGSDLAIPPDAQQLIVVSSPTEEPPGYVATLRAYERTGASSSWRAVFGPWQAETGYGHLRAVRREGDGATPLGVFQIGSTMYGTAPDPGALHYPYHRLVCGDWWDEDPYSSAYNRFVQVACGSTPPFASWSEALWTETLAYPYLAVVQFNTDPIVGGAQAPGSGIFLHSWVGGATAGCVALHEAQLLQLLRWLEPSAHPVIAIGTASEVHL